MSKSKFEKEAQNGVLRRVQHGNYPGMQRVTPEKTGRFPARLAAVAGRVGTDLDETTGPA